MKGKLIVVLGFVFGCTLAELLYLMGVRNGLGIERERIIKWLRAERCPECYSMVDRMINYLEHKDHWDPLP